MNERNILIVRAGEVALKGMNKPYFERMLVDRIKANLKKISEVGKDKDIDIYRHEGLIYVKADKALDIDEIIHETVKVFGVASVSKAVEAESDLDAIGAGRLSSKNGASRPSRSRLSELTKTSR